MRPFLLEGDGIELLTGFSPVPESLRDGTVGVHLPYAIDWYGIWSDEKIVPAEVPDASVPYIYYGRDREEIISNLTEAVRCAAALHPEYAVLHASNANLNELFAYEYNDTDSKVLYAFAEMVNELFSSFPGGQPPFLLLFENTWWPGLRMLDDSDYWLLQRKIEFDNWGICLDTGHLLVSMKSARNESDSIDEMARILDRYPKELIDRIVTMHLHVNSSADPLKDYPRGGGIDSAPIMQRVERAYGYVSSVDQHRPFSLRSVTRLVEMVQPKFVTHEMGAQDPVAKVADYRQQRKLFQH
jgi:hypothetical protein